MPLDLFQDKPAGERKTIDLFSETAMPATGKLSVSKPPAGTRMSLNGLPGDRTPISPGKPGGEPSVWRKADIALGKIVHPLMYYSGLEGAGRLWDLPANVGYGLWEGGKKALRGDTGGIIKAPARAAYKTLKGEGYYDLEQAGLPVPESRTGRIAAETAWHIGKNPLNVMAPWRGRLITKMEPPKPVPVSKLGKIDPESIGKTAEVPKEAPRPTPKAPELSDVERIETLIDEISPKGFKVPKQRKEVAPKPKAFTFNPSKTEQLKSRVKTEPKNVGDEIANEGGINFVNFKSELESMPAEVKRLSSLDGVPVDLLEQRLKGYGYLDEGEDLLEFLRSNPKALKRRKLTEDILDKPFKELSAEQKDIRRQMEYEPEAPPEIKTKVAATIEEKNFAELVDFFEHKGKEVRGMVASERGSVELPSLEPLKRTVETLEESHLIKGAKEKLKRTVEGISEAVHSPERVYQKDPAGKKIYQLIDQADQKKNAFLYQRGKELKLVVGKIKEGSVESVRIGQALDGKLDPVKLTPAERKAYDFMKESYGFLVQKYARTVAGSEEGYKRALNASLNKHAAKAKVQDLPEDAAKLYGRLKKGLQYVRKGRPLKELSEAERAKYWQVREEMGGLLNRAWKETLSEGEASAYDILTRRIRDYLPHIFDKDELLSQFKTEAVRIRKKLETATAPGAVTQYKDRLRMIREAIVNMEKGQLVTYEALPRNVRFRFFETRKGAAGYSFDSVKAYQTYLHGIARKIYDEPAIRQAASLHEKLDPSLKGYNRWYLRHYMRWDRHKLDDLAGTIASFEWMRTLGANPRSAIVNLTQRLNTVAEVGVKHSLKGEALGFTKKGSQLFDQTGIAQEIPTVLMEGSVPQGMEKARAILGYMFNKVELGNRKHAFLSNYSKTIAAGLSEKEAIRAGIDTVHKTQFRYGKVGMPKMLTHPVGRLAGQFMSYPIKQIELITDWAKNDPKKLIKYLAYAEGGNYALNEFLGIDLSNALGFGLNYGEAVKALQDIPKNDWRAFFRHVNLTFSSGGGLLPSGLGPSVSGALKVAEAVGKGHGWEQLKKELRPVQYKRIVDAYKAVINRRDELYPMHDRRGHVMYFLTAPQLATRTFGPRTGKESQQYTDWRRSSLLEKERQEVLRDITRAIVDDDTKKANQLIEKYKIFPTDKAIEKEALRRKATREELGRLDVPGKRDLWQLRREGQIIP